MTVGELAAEWRQHRATIYKKIADGEIPAIRLGGETAALRIPRSALTKMIEGSTSGGSFADSAPGEPAMGRSFVENPAERRETQTCSGQLSSRQPAGGKR